MTPGQRAYEAYSEAVGGKSVAGKPLPAWDGQKVEIAAAWEAAASAVIADAGPAIRSAIGAGPVERAVRATLGDEEGRDRVEAIYIPPGTPQPL